MWRLPAPPDARGPGQADYALVFIFGVQAILEATTLRPDMAWRWLSLAVFFVWLPTLLVRRTRPLLMPVVFAAASSTLTVMGLVDGTTPEDLNTGVVALLIPFSLTRWARGRDAVLGLALFLLVAGTALVTQPISSGDRIGGTAVVVTAIAVGALLRSRSLLRGRELEDVRRDERDRLARDLHDTVAHHLTAIAISAQAGLAVADSRPEATTEALRRIDEEATRTLAETRKVLRMLRTEDGAPDRPLDDLAGLAAPGGPGPAVEVVIAADLDLSPTVAAAIQRIAREAVSNARRHALGASVVKVRVARRGDDVELSITDDGHPPTSSAAGFGILGMTERAALLGGRLDAGPAPDGGWRVTAVIPSATVAHE